MPQCLNNPGKQCIIEIGYYWWFDSRFSVIFRFFQAFLRRIYTETILRKKPCGNRNSRRDDGSRHSLKKRERREALTAFFRIRSESGSDQIRNRIRLKSGSDQNQIRTRIGSDSWADQNPGRNLAGAVKDYGNSGDRWSRFYRQPHSRGTARCRIWCGDRGQSL